MPRWPTVGIVSQLSFFSAEAVPPAVADLTGILAAPGQVVLVGQGHEQAARVSVVVDAQWRAEALAEMTRQILHGRVPLGRTRLAHHDEGGESQGSHAEESRAERRPLLALEQRDIGIPEQE
jgi:hypothetical protein